MYVLILMLASAGQGSAAWPLGIPAVATAEFSSLKACVEAGKAAMADHPPVVTVRYQCAKK